MLGGALALAAAVGVSRFFYTAILPRMMQEHALTATAAGVLATSNLAGYFAGSALTPRGFIRSAADRRLMALMILNVLGLAAMEFADDVAAWIVWRLLAGICSGVMFVGITQFVADRLTLDRGPQRLMLLYTGVGAGIFMSGSLAAIPVSEGAPVWAGAAAVAALLFIGALWVLSSAGPSANATLESHPPGGSRETSPALWTLAIAYLLEGFGYIIGGTFMVADFRYRFALGIEQSGIVWACVGLAAAPSCILWASALKLRSSVQLLQFAYILQLLGFVLPLLTNHALAAWISAALFGGTFMGITSLTLYRVRYELGAPAGVGRLTALYALGQMLGPSIAGWIADKARFPDAVLIVAAIPVAAALSLITLGRFRPVRSDFPVAIGVRSHALREYQSHQRRPYTGKEGGVDRWNNSPAAKDIGQEPADDGYHH